MKQLRVLFCIVVIDLLGFGIIIPLFPYMGLRMGAAAQDLTPILAVYSLAQFLAAPIWGRLSDRFGRRPILMSSMLGAALSYFMLAFGDSFGWLVASRVLAGLMAGNISAALAYASDVTTPESRSRGMGMIGAAIGVGFMFGPVLGGQLAGADPTHANYLLPVLVAAGLSLSACLAVVLWLPESNTAELRSRQRQAASGSLTRAQVLRRPVLLSFLGAVLLVTTAHAILESVVAFWAHDRLGFGPRTLGLFLFMIGALMVLMQGVAVGYLTRQFGERRVAVTGIAVYLCGLVLIAAAVSLPLALCGAVLCGLGLGAYNPSLSSLISQQAAPGERGVVMGTYQSAGSLARIVGPAMSGPLYAGIGGSAPFLLGAAIALPSIWLVLRARRLLALADLPAR